MTEELISLDNIYSIWGWLIYVSNSRDGHRWAPKAVSIVLIDTIPKLSQRQVKER